MVIDDSDQSPYLSYELFLHSPLQEEDTSTWARAVDTISEIASFGFLSFAEVKIKEKTETLSKGDQTLLTIQKPEDRTYYFKTYAGLLQHTKEITKQQFQQELANHNPLFTQEQIYPVEKSAPYAGAMLSISLSVETRIRIICKLNKTLIIPAILTANAYR